VKRGLRLGLLQTAARAKSPAPMPLGVPRRLIVGHASAREMRASGPTGPKMEWLKNSSSEHGLFDDTGRCEWRRSHAGDLENCRALRLTPVIVMILVILESGDIIG
jgi:hypothetical protein